jgi:hypothetical protein
MVPELVLERVLPPAQAQSWWQQITPAHPKRVVAGRSKPSAAG